MYDEKVKGIESTGFKVKDWLVSDLEVFVYNLKRFVDTYSDVGNVSQQTLHFIRIKGWKITSTVKFLIRLHNVSTLKKFYTYTFQIISCFGKIRDMDTMIGLLNSEKSPRSLVKDFSNKRHKYMKEAYKKVSKVLDKYVEVSNQFLEEIENEKYILRFKDLYKVYKMITNEYYFSKLSFLLEPSYELFNNVRVKLKNVKYLFWLLTSFFDVSGLGDESLLNYLKDTFIAINDFQRSLSHFRDIITLVGILSKISLRVSRKKDFVDSFLNSRKNVWQDAVSSFRERQIRIDYRLNNVLRMFNKMYNQSSDPDRYLRIQSYIEEFALKNGSNLTNSKVMYELAVRIYREFDKLNFLVYDSFEEFVIKGACIIHDVGMSFSEESYHKLSMEKFVEADIREIKTKEKLFIALVARYHTRSIPKYSHKWYTNLKDHDKMIINRLSAFVRFSFSVCKMLDFNVSLSSIENTRDSIVINLKSPNKEKFNLDEADKLLLERMIGIPINISISE
ncbi:MAG: hypothetical protein ACP5QP_02605 [Brevinematia bacterium]